MIRRPILALLLALSFDAAAQRTIPVTMDDTMRYAPSEITVKAGEKVRFVATNKGQLVHEMVIGTKKELEEHAQLMRKHAGMQHDHPGMLRLKPGETGGLDWQSRRAGTFYYGCLESGHYEAGMIGTITVQ